MVSGSYLKQARGENDNFPDNLTLVKENVRKADWESARHHLEDTEKAWEEVLPRIQFSMERGEINNLTVSLARARAAIMAQDKPGALMELEEAASHWHRLGN